MNRAPLLAGSHEPDGVHYQPRYTNERHHEVDREFTVFERAIPAQKKEEYIRFKDEKWHGFDPQSSVFKLLAGRYFPNKAEGRILTVAEVVNSNFWEFLLLVIGSAVPLYLSLFSSMGEEFELDLDAGSCRAAARTCTSSSPCTWSDFSKPCGAGSLPITDATGGSEAPVLSNDTCTGIYSAISALPYTHYARFWVEVSLCVLFYFTCGMYAYWEWKESLHTRVALFLGGVYRPLAARKTMSRLISEFLHQYLWIAVVVGYILVLHYFNAIAELHILTAPGENNTINAAKLADPKQPPHNGNVYVDTCDLVGPGNPLLYTYDYFFTVSWTQLLQRAWPLAHVMFIIASRQKKEFEWIDPDQLMDPFDEGACPYRDIVQLRRRVISKDEAADFLVDRRLELMNDWRRTHR